MCATALQQRSPGLAAVTMLVSSAHFLSVHSRVSPLSSQENLSEIANGNPRLFPNGPSCAVIYLDAHQGLVEMFHLTPLASCLFDIAASTPPPFTGKSMYGAQNFM